MPDGPEPLDNSIDITLSMLDGRHMDEFMKELTTVRENFEKMTFDLKGLADSFNKVAESVGKAGEYTSRPTGHDLGERPDGASSAAQVNKDQADLFGDPYRQTEAGVYASRPDDEERSVDEAARVSQTSPVEAKRDLIYTPENSEELTKRALARIHSHHPLEAMGLGMAEAFKLHRGQKSDGASDNENINDQLQIDNLDSTFQPESLVPPAEAKTGILDNLTAAKGTITDALRQRWNPDMSGEDESGGGRGTGLLGVGTLANVMTNFHLAHSFANQNAGEQQREFSGSTFGYDQTGGDVAIPGTDIGFRMPFGNPASREMVKEDFEKMKYRAQPGLNKDQVNQIFNAGYQQGFTPQTEQSTDVFRTAMGDMMKKNSAMAEDPTYQGMLGEAIKYGAISLKDFNANMQQIPIIAAKANVGLGDFMQGVGELSQQITGMGGNPFQAADWATQFTARTGLAPSDMSTLAKSPFFATEAYQKTGLLPFEQGLMSGAQATQVATQSVFDLAKMPGLHFGNIKVKSPDGGSGTISGASQQAAMIASITGLPEQKVANMLKNRKRIESENAMEMDARQMLSQLRKAHGNKGKISATMDPNNVNAHDNITTMGDLKKRMADAGFSKDEQNAVMHAGKKKHSRFGIDALAKDSNQDPVTAMEGRIKKMQQIEAEHASKGRGKGGKTTEIKLDLTDAAKTLLKVVGNDPMVNPASVVKDLANAGDALPNAAFGMAKSALNLNPVSIATHLLHVNLPGPF